VIEKGPLSNLRFFVGQKENPKKAIEVTPTSLFTSESTIFYEGLNITGELVID